MIKLLLLAALLTGCGRPRTDVEALTPMAYTAGQQARHLSEADKREAYMAFLSQFVACPPTVETEAIMRKEFYRAAGK